MSSEIGNIGSHRIKEKNWAIKLQTSWHNTGVSKPHELKPDKATISSNRFLSVFKDLLTSNQGNKQLGDVF